jgi:hypothetical protein
MKTRRPLLPLAVALPRMLQETEAALANARPAEKLRLQRRAEFIRGLLVNPVTKIGFEASPPFVN